MLHEYIMHLTFEYDVQFVLLNFKNNIELEIMQSRTIKNDQIL